MVDLGAPVQFVKGVGPQRAAALGKLGILTVEDLLLHLPMRYEDRRHPTPIAKLQAGMRAVVAGTVVVAGLRRTRRMALLEARIEDASGRIKAVWFNQPYLADVIERGRRVVLYGPVEPDTFSGGLTLHSPQWELVEDADTPGLHTGRVVPVYEKLGPLTGKALRRILTQLARELPDELPDPLPPDVRERLGVVTRAQALRRAHDPAEDDDVTQLNAARGPAHRRLILEEFFLFQAGLALRRRGLHEERKGVSFTIDDRIREAVRRVLPFRLTGAQKRVSREIADDMRSPHPMHRLVQGDVGSGKTIVALLSMVVAVENGYQAAFMAPTEILAEQHGHTLRRILAPSPYRVELLSAARKGKARAQALEAIAQGAAQIVVGTHALIQEGVTFARLGLAVIDEQHRFGVLQREDLVRKGYAVDVLVMTATPIPRTLSLTAFGDLDVSVVDERPPGRTPVRTLHRAASERRAVVELVRREVEAGRQAYVVYPLVEESEKLEDVRAATEAAAEWAAALPALRIGLLHGRLKPAEKDDVMGRFTARELDVLVSTTVIEVGVDVPNATIMVIEHAERFGLAQLHQLRGRVGRGSGASTCVLVTSGRLSEEARARIEVLLKTEDGFAIAERDLELRGPGDFFGTRQWGLPNLRVAHLLRDRDLLELARTEAFRWVQDGAQGPLASLLEGHAWERRFGLAQVG